MIHQHQNGFGSNLNIHQFYMDIINCMPNIVYWIDLDCNLQGCNLNFVKLLGLSHYNKCSATPYELIAKHLSWTNESIDAFKLNDMEVMFENEARYSVEEEPVSNKNGESLYYSSTRVPLYDEDKHVIGLIVVLADITAEKILQKQLKQEKPADKPTESAKRSDVPLRVLLVEDSLIAQNVERSVLDALNCEVDMAETGDQASTLFSPGKYDLVIMDISLQDTTGYIVSKAFRKLEQNTEHRVPIIAITQYLGDKVQTDCHYYGMDGVITKPLTHEQAMQIIKHYVYDEDVSVDGLHSI